MKQSSPNHKNLMFILPVLYIMLMLTPLISADNGGMESQYLGKVVFNEKGCINCHSINGKGGKGGPDLGTIKYYGTHLQMAATMWSHFPRMQKKMEASGQKFPTFTVEEMSNLIDYLLFQRYCGQIGNGFRGRKLLHSMECFTCHKFGGKGGTIGPDISAKKEFISPMCLVEAMWNHGPEMMPIFEDNHIKRPEFYGNDIVDIATAIQSFMTPTRIPTDAYSQGNCETGKNTIQTKGCLKCHDLNGSGADIGPSFNDMDFNCTILEFAGRIWNHGPKMWRAMQENNIDIPTFESGDLCNIISFLYNMKMTDAPGDPLLGQKLLTEKKCLDCHQLNGIGNKVAKKNFDQIDGLVSPIALIALMWSHAPAMDEKRIEKHLRWPRLTDRDMANLYAYLDSINN